jgi:hypothetical protein
MPIEAVLYASGERCQRSKGYMAGRIRMAEPAFSIEEVSNPHDIARAQDERHRRNINWLQTHWADVLPQACGKFLAVAGQEPFIADTPEAAWAWVATTHPEDDGALLCSTCVPRPGHVSMLVRGEWQLCDDGVRRPMVRARMGEDGSPVPFPTVSGKFPRRIPGHAHAWTERMKLPMPQIEAGVSNAGLPSRKDPL